MPQTASKRRVRASGLKTLAGSRAFAIFGELGLERAPRQPESDIAMAASSTTVMDASYDRKRYVKAGVQFQTFVEAELSERLARGARHGRARWVTAPHRRVAAEPLLRRGARCAVPAASRGKLVSYEGNPDITPIAEHDA